MSHLYQCYKNFFKGDFMIKVEDLIENKKIDGKNKNIITAESIKKAIINKRRVILDEKTE